MKMAVEPFHLLSKRCPGNHECLALLFLQVGITDGSQIDYRWDYFLLFQSFPDVRAVGLDDHLRLLFPTQAFQLQLSVYPKASFHSGPYLLDISEKNALQKMREILTFAIRWRNLQNIFFCKIEVGAPSEEQEWKLFLSYGAANGAVRTNVFIQEVDLDLDKVILVALIINEWVSNALEHGFSDIAAGRGGAGEIRVHLSLGPDRSVRLCVSDNGAGSPEH